MKRKVEIFISTLAGLYLLLCVGLYFFQDMMLFPGAWSQGSREFVSTESIEAGHLHTADGTKYRIALGKPAQKPRGVLIFFVGNGEDLVAGVRRVEDFAGYGLQTLVTEYPGYGASEGKAGFESILAAAESSAQRGRELAESQGVPLFVGGQSLGTFPAMHVATMGFGQRLLLASPPTSVKAAGKSRYPFLPIGLLIRHPFDNLSNAEAIHIPTLIVHGSEDRTVPVEMGEQMARAISGARLLVAEGRGHNDLFLGRTGPFAEAIEQLLNR